MIVVDATVALRAAAAPDGFDVLASHDPVAPALMWSEATSALSEALWRGDIGSSLAAQTRQALLGAPISRQAPRRLLDEAWSVARELGWAKTYDAEYVALARLRGCRLVTLDARLRRGAGRAIEVIGPAEL
jgi:predicted nucleic acid-binding protein